MLASVLSLVKHHPWNTLVQVKTHAIFEELLGPRTPNAQKFEIIRDSGLTECLVDLSTAPNFRFNETHTARNGQMGFVIKLAQLVKKLETFESAFVEVDEAERAKVFDEEWQDFIATEYTTSLAQNNKDLGGRPRCSQDDEDESNQFDVNMEKIMSRFNTFNSLLSHSSSNEDDDEDEVEAEEEIPTDCQFSLEEAEKSLERPGTPVDTHRVEVELPKEDALRTEFTDATYWQTNVCDQDLDSLLADFE